MSAVNVPPVAAVGVVLGVGLLAYAWMQKTPGQSLAASVGASAVGAVVDVGAGAVVGLGQAVGIPATSGDQCTIDLENGDYWAASFSCPASRFIGASTSAAKNAVFGASTPKSTGGATGSW
jgi:hypothetical protein